MWSFASRAFAGKLSSSNSFTRTNTSEPDCSDDEVSSCTGKEEGLECPICWEFFNIVENVPYVLWCGHTLCKNCVLGLHWAVVKLPTVQIQLPLFVSCPWCSLLSFRFVYKGNLKFPRKNYFILWMVESINSDRPKPNLIREEHRLMYPVVNAGVSGSRDLNHQHTRRAHSEHSDSSRPHAGLLGSYLNSDRIHASLRKTLVLFMQLTAKFPLVIIFLLVILYVVPTCAAILALYILITVLFALPSILLLYFAYPTLDWLIREIFA